MNIAIISFSKLDRDPRVRRQIRHLCTSNDVYTIGLTGSGEKVKGHLSVAIRPVTTSFDKLHRILKYVLRNHFKTYWYYYPKPELEFLNGSKIDLIISNDFNAAPYALKLKEVFPQAKLLLDAHEYTPRQKEDLWNWRLFEQPYQKFIVKNTIDKIDGMLTVAPGLADEYFNNYGVNPDVMVNAAPYYSDIKITPVDDHIDFIYHGYANVSRNIDLLVRVFGVLDTRYKLYLMLVGEKVYIENLKVLAKPYNNVIFLDPVPMTNIVETINSYDVGISFFPPVSFNLKNALPNKFFESIQARLAVLSGPTDSMKSYIEQYNLGVVTDDFTAESLKRSIQALTPELVQEYKENVDKAAELLSEKTSLEVLDKKIQEVLN